MFADELPEFARARSAGWPRGGGHRRGLRRPGDLQPQADLRQGAQRIEWAHRPYHAALAALLPSTKPGRARPGHIDRLALDAGGGDRAAACANGHATWCWAPIRGGLRRPAVVAGGARAGEPGYRVARNTPYAGGYTTEHYGRPARRVHALQIEINRALYLDERSSPPPAASRACRSIWPTSPGGWPPRTGRRWRQSPMR
jgi:hypothetical protein